MSIDLKTIQMTLVGLAARKLSVKKRNAKLAAAFPNGVRCQKCLQLGHWSYECKEKRKFVHRSSRTKQLKKRLAEKVATENNDSGTVVSTTSEITKSSKSKRARTTFGSTAADDASQESNSDSQSSSGSNENGSSDSDEDSSSDSSSSDSDSDSSGDESSSNSSASDTTDSSGSSTSSSSEDGSQISLKKSKSENTSSSSDDDI